MRSPANRRGHLCHGNLERSPGPSEARLGACLFIELCLQPAARAARG
jgi:hypothetical protein